LGVIIWEEGLVVGVALEEVLGAEVGEEVEGQTLLMMIGKTWTMRSRIKISC